MTTNGFALIDRKTKKIVWIGLEKPKEGAFSHYWYIEDKFFQTNFHSVRFALIPVTITPKPKRKR